MSFASAPGKCFTRQKDNQTKKHGPKRVLQSNADQTRTGNLLIRSQTPCPLGHSAQSDYIWISDHGLYRDPMGIIAMFLFSLFSKATFPKCWAWTPRWLTGGEGRQRRLGGGRKTTEAALRAGKVEYWFHAHTCALCLDFGSGDALMQWCLFDKSNV